MLCLFVFKSQYVKKISNVMELMCIIPCLFILFRESIPLDAAKPAPASVLHQCLRRMCHSYAVWQLKCNSWQLLTSTVVRSQNTIKFLLAENRLKFDLIDKVAETHP